VAFLPCAPEFIGETVVELLALDRGNSQVLGAVRNGPAGTKTLNALCQERFTAGAAEVKCWNAEFDCEERVGLRLGDTVLCTRNMWSLGLQNGSLGTVVEVEDTPRVLHDDAGEEAGLALAWVEWDDGQRRALTVVMLEDIELGYAVTVHKAQGSQWQRVIVPVNSSKLLDRTLLYTALTRAQTQVLLVGDVDVVRAAVLAPPRANERKVALDLALMRLMERTT
jgi:exodeoxyribonuclease V alpha subunit